MSKSLEREVRSYCKAVKSRCPRSLRKRLANELGATVYDFAAENPGVSMKDVVAHFGTPEQFAADVIVHMDAGDRAKFVRSQRLIKIGVVASVLAVIALSAVGAYEFVKLNDESAGTYYEIIVRDYGIGSTIPQ